ncbi:MAG: putative photosynthetic complex assembly protein PuhE [Pseudomonadota bacterium]
MTILFAFAFALVTWWLTTGLVAFAVRVGDGQRPAVLVGFGGLALLGIAGLIWSSNYPTLVAAYVGFASALAVWSFHEAAFLMGIVTGSRSHACPKGAAGWRRFVAAFRAIDHHEISLFVTVVALVFLLGGGANPVGPLLLAVMWVMRLSTKLIVFHGAPNAISDLMPPRVRYLNTYFRTDRVTPFFPLALALSACLLIVLADATVRAPSVYAMAGHTLVGTFVLLAVAEHLFLMVPWRDAGLWDWAIRKDGAKPIGPRSASEAEEPLNLTKVEISQSIQRSGRSVVANHSL